MNQEFITALDQLENEKNISKEELIQAIEASIASAYKKNYRDVKGVDVVIDRETGEITVYETKEVVEEVTDPKTEISVEEARKINPLYDISDQVKVATTPKDFGRIAAQNAKQLIMQKILEAERNRLYDEYSKRINENINATVTRFNRGNVYVSLGSVDAVMPPSEQIPHEKYRRGERLKVYLVNARNSPKGVQLKVSRTHPDFIKRLFEAEIPEFSEGVLDIKSIAREPGFRTKVAVVSSNKHLDVIGTCIGRKRTRIQNILNELGDERIDIVEYSPDIEKYLKSALSPAQIDKILINYDKKAAMAIVDQSQLALAIGKEGKNVQLAAKLTGWKIDIKSKEQFEELLKENPDYEEEFTKQSDLSKSEQKIRELLEDDLFFEEDSPEEPISENDLFNDESIKKLFEED